jgi:hypothetical protein
MAVSGQLCRVAEGLSYHDIELAHRHPPPSPQKSDTCANPVQKFRRAAPFLQGGILDSYKSVPPGKFGVVTAGTNYAISTSKIASREIECHALPLFWKGMLCYQESRTIIVGSWERKTSGLGVGLLRGASSPPRSPRASSTTPSSATDIAAVLKKMQFKLSLLSFCTSFSQLSRCGLATPVFTTVLVLVPRFVGNRYGVPYA